MRKSSADYCQAASIFIKKSLGSGFLLLLPTHSSIDFNQDNAKMPSPNSTVSFHPSAAFHTIDHTSVLRPSGFCDRHCSLLLCHLLLSAPTPHAFFFSLHHEPLLFLLRYQCSTEDCFIRQPVRMFSSTCILLDRKEMKG